MVFCSLGFKILNEKFFDNIWDRVLDIFGWENLKFGNFLFLISYDGF